MSNLRIVLCVLFVCSVALGLSVWRSEIVSAIDLVIPSQQPAPVATPPADDQTDVIVLDANAPNALAAGTLTASDATFVRPNSACAGLSGNTTRFDAYPFTVTTAGTKTLSLEAADGGSITPNGTDGNGPDTFLVLYNGAFSPGSPLTNCSTTNDDINGSSNRRSRITSNLTEGSYTVVVTSFNATPTTTTGDAALPWTYSLAINGGVTLTVTKTADTNDGVCDTDCSLREAIASAASGDTITFSSLFNSAQTITLGSQLLVDKNLTINGPGADLLTLSGNNAVRVLEVNAGTNVAISGVAIINGSSGDGAGINNLGSLTVTDCTVRSNQASNNGGGIHNSGGNLTVVRSTINGNTGNDGGGLHNATGTMTVANSTISGNTATVAGGTGAIVNIGFGGGTASLTVTNSTITGNTGQSEGGIGTYQQGSNAATTIRNSIISGNSLPNLRVSGAGATITSQGFNLTNDNGGGFLTATGDQINTNPRLGTLANNGGRTQTHALLGGSPALDKGSNSGSPLPTTDQRGAGFTRVVNLAIENSVGGDGTDIGAFEAASIPNCGLAATPITIGQTLNGSLAPGDCHYTRDGGATAGNDGTLYDAYTFSGTAGQQVAIAMTSTLPAGSGGFDTVLRLYQGNFPGGTFVTENDDIDGANNRNSRIPVTGFFTLPSTGTHTIIANAFATDGVGDYTVNLTQFVPDATVPTAIGSAPNVTTAGATSHTATVVYSDNVAINASTVGIGDIRITGPNGFDQPTDFQNVTPGGNGTPRTANYPFPVPGGWTFAKNGTYNIVMQANQVADTSGNFVAAGTIGTFTVNIPASPQTFVVNSLADPGDGTCDGANCTLREAITAANANSPAADTINFQAGLTGTITLTGSEMIVTDSVAINGPGASVISVSGGNASRIFQFNPGSMSLTGLTLTGGNGVGGNSGFGGAILSFANLTISNCTVTGSAATTGGGISNAGTLMLVGSLVSNNTATGGGGGIFSQSALTVTDSTILGNTAANGGGVLTNNGGTFNMSRSTVSGNTATFQGGGLNLQNTSGSVTSSTISGNTANSATFPGAVFVVAFSGTRTVQFVNTTIANNLTGTPNTVGGLMVFGQGAGSSATATLRNSIIANNGSINLLAGTGGGGGIGTITSQGFNLTSDNGGGFLTGTSDQINTNPLLGPLVSNGGPTRTHALLAGSPAIDKGDNTGSGQTTDQRGSGFTRTIDLAGITNAGDGTDIGAFEAQTAPVAPPTISIEDVSRVEGNSGLTAFGFNINLSAPSAQTITVTINTADGTATAPSDYTTPILGNTFTFNPGEQTKTATIQVNGDTSVEPNETFFVNLSNPTNATIADGQGQGTIINDDFVPATFVVTNLNNSGPGSLRQAILDANANSPAADTINFQAGLTGTINLLTALPNIADSVTINGPGANLLTVRRDAAAEFRIFSIFGATNGVAISGMTITGGNAGSGVNNFGGGILSGSPLTLTNVHVTGNAAGDGGGVNLSSADGVFTNCTFSNNESTDADGGGGGVRLEGQNARVLRINNSTISGNRSLNNIGGGVSHVSFSGTSRVEITNSTIVGNTALNAGGVLSFTVGNTTAITTLRNTIVANNSPNNFGTGTFNGGTPTFQTLGFNLSDNFNGVFTPAGTDITGNPLLGALASNGGPTQTHALLAGSPAIDKGSNAGSGVTTDQRGLTRPRDLIAISNAAGGDGSDIGAYEEQNEPAPTPTPTPTATPTPTPTPTPPPANIVVTNTNDSGPGSLRQAIADVASGGAITFSSLFRGPDPADPDSPDAAQTITLTSGELFIDKSMTITGPGANLLTISGNNASRVFRINTVTVGLSGMTITGGNVVDGNGGGGIFNFGNLTLSSSVVTQNQTTNRAGGGINQFAAGNLTIIDSTISGNTATDDGGGVLFDNAAGSFTVTNSTISGNTVLSTNGQGGGIWSRAAVASITNSTITNNSTGGDGTASGLYRRAGSVTLRNTIVAGNQSNFTRPDVVADAGTGIASNGYNLVGNPGSLAIFSQTGDQAGTAVSPLNPLLGPLQNNGGTTPTHALQAGSPAIDGGNSSGSFNDQRGPGFLRVVDLLAPNAPGGDGADIGAFELQAEPPPATATISGRVLRPSGQALSNTRVFLTDEQGNRLIATTSSFGIFSFNNVTTGQTYFLTVSSKRFRFSPQTLLINGNISGLDLLGLE